MEPLGPKIRRQRRRLGLTLDELSGRTSISKPYLSLIETGRVPNPPSDEKLRRLEQTLGFSSGELLTQAHLYRTPRDVRAMLGKLLADGNGKHGPLLLDAKGVDSKSLVGAAASSVASESDITYLSGALRELAERSSGDMEKLSSNAVPVINRIASDYPKDFMDMSYPPRVADDYVGCPDISDKQAFAARVHGDSMTPKYRQGDIVIFSPAMSPRNGDDCFIRFADGKTTFKRVFFESEGRSRSYRLQPRNERHRPTTVAMESVSGLYRAIYRYQKVDED